MTSSPRSAAVVVNYGSHELLAKNLKVTAAGVDVVVVVDNFSTTTERAAVTALADAEGWNVERPDANLGFGGGMNLGVARAVREGATTLLLINPDAGLDAEGARALHARVHADRSVLVAPHILRPDGTSWLARTADLHLVDGRMRSKDQRPVPASDGTQPTIMEWLSGACLALSLDLWDATGGFDDDYFLYWEDVDLSRRVHAAGGHLDIASDVHAVHDEGGTHDDHRAGRTKSSTYYYYNIRNRLVFGAKWLDDDAYAVWRRGALGAARAFVLQGGRRQLATSTVPWRVAIRATRDGLRSGRLIRAERAGGPR